MTPFRRGTKSERIWLLLRAGASQQDVALTTGAHPKFVAQVAARLKEEAPAPRPVDARARGWTAERVEQLKALYAAGLSCGEIAARMGGITRNAVLGKVHRLGLPLRGNDHLFGRTRQPCQTKRRRERRDSPFRLLLAARRAAPAPLPVIESETGRVPFLALEPGACRYIPGDVRVDSRACGDPIVPGLPYCERHALRCFAQPLPRRQPPAESAPAVQPDKVEA
jgi:GcrA cell cycle regulator